MNEAQNDKSYSSMLKERIMAWGADLVGFADTEPHKAQHLDPPDLLDLIIQERALCD